MPGDETLMRRRTAARGRTPALHAGWPRRPGAWCVRFEGPHDPETLMTFDGAEAARLSQRRATATGCPVTLWRDGRPVARFAPEAILGSASRPEQRSAVAPAAQPGAGGVATGGVAAGRVESGRAEQAAERAPGRDPGFNPGIDRDGVPGIDSGGVPGGVPGSVPDLALLARLVEAGWYLVRPRRAALAPERPGGETPVVDQT